MHQPFHIEAETIQGNRQGATCCGDVCLSRKLKEENRVVTVLADGMGQGIKANILASMTTSMAMQFAMNHEPAWRTAEFIINTLPYNDVRKMANSSFTIMDINFEGQVKLVEFNNPPALLFRSGNYDHIVRSEKLITTANGNHQVFYSEFKLEKEDRLVLISNGVSLSGLGSNHHPLGWNEGLVDYVEMAIDANGSVSATQLSKKIIDRAKANDGGMFKDDATCCVIYCREPRKLIVATGPPYHKKHDKLLADTLQHFKGKRVVCGGTTAQILSREFNEPIEVSLDFTDYQLPPASKMKGIDLVTEGILTLGKVSGLLEGSDRLMQQNSNPAEQLFKLMMGCDEIHFMVGTRINEAHHDPNLPVELEIRRNVLKKITHLLEEKYLKDVEIQYL